MATPRGRVRRAAKYQIPKVRNTRTDTGVMLQRRATAKRAGMSVGPPARITGRIYPKIQAVRNNSGHNGLAPRLFGLVGNTHGFSVYSAGLGGAFSGAGAVAVGAIADFVGAGTGVGAGIGLG
jgi:hypothetical protein